MKIVLMAVFPRRRLFFSILLFFFCVSPSYGSELVGVLPLSNQRPGESDWIGFYIRARIHENLRRNSNWAFHSLRTLQCWNFVSDRSQPVSPDTTVLVGGSFQRVIDYGHLDLQLRRFHNQSVKAKQISTFFDFQNLDETIRQVSTQIGQWIDSDFVMRAMVSFPEYHTPEAELFGRMQQHLFLPDASLEPYLILQLMELIEPDDPSPLIAALAEGMILLGPALNEVEKTDLWREAENLLRKAIRHHPNEGALYLLLAEAYYLENKLLDWVTKTAGEAVQRNPQLALGYGLILLSMDDEQKGDISVMADLERVNPWFWASIRRRSFPFQKGILDGEWLSLAERLGK